jgi:hypothetical protein
MTFNDLHLKHKYQRVTVFFTLVRWLLTDKRLRIPLIILMASVVFISFSCALYSFQKNRMDTLVVKLSAQTTEILRRVDVSQHQAEIPKFEASMKAVGAYHPSITADACASHVSRCFLQKNKPEIGITVKKQEIVDTLYTIQSFDVKFKSSFDYEIFDMMEYILSNPSKFGYTRLREFEIEQLFETSPIVKGLFVYDQLSLTP